MSSCLQAWPEPIIRVQSLSDSGITTIPERYVKRHSTDNISSCQESDSNNIPVIDLSKQDDQILEQVSKACRKWGFFQVVNHGVSTELMESMRGAWREFFQLPLEEKQLYANSPDTYEGYGSRIGVEKGSKLDWSDYFFLNYLPHSIRDTNKWPRLPVSCRDFYAETHAETLTVAMGPTARVSLLQNLVMEYGEELIKLCGKLMKIFSITLGLEEEYLQKVLGGEDIGVILRANYYPKCPQPELAFGLSPHSDPGGMTLLLPDNNVLGLQVRQGNSWITVKHIPDALIVNIGDQLQVLSNAIYKSVEHRVTVNSTKERVSIAFFYNPKGSIPIEPAKELIREDHPALYPSMTYNEYRLFIRKKGLCGKSQVESLKHPL